MKIDQHASAGNSRIPLAIGFGILFAILYVFPIRELISYVLHPENRRYNSHIVFIPIVSAYLLYEHKKVISKHALYSVPLGFLLVLAGIFLYLLGGQESIVSGQTNRISLLMVSAVFFTVGGFIAIYGTTAFRYARFPLLFLLFVVPLPTGLMDATLYVLQVFSTEISYVLFKLSGVPIFREGFVFAIPGMSIEVAKECSGARATITLFIITVLAGHLFLRSFARKVLLALSTFPITVFGNSIRIVGLTFLGLYVDKAYIEGASLPHLRGGWLFFMVDLVIAAGVLMLLRRGDEDSLGRDFRDITQ